jgi:hypothetical protein
MTDDVWLFSYGTLQQEEVQLATFGRRLDGRAAAADTYEVSAYKRIAARLKSGLEAFVYVAA